MVVNPESFFFRFLLGTFHRKPRGEGFIFVMAVARGAQAFSVVKQAVSAVGVGVCVVNSLDNSMARLRKIEHQLGIPNYGNILENTCCMP